MPEENREIEIRSHEVQEIMSHVPNWMIRWGISLIFVIIMIFLFLSWIIKYPDVIDGSVTLTTVNAPVKLINKNSAEISQIYFKDQSVVKKGDVIAVLNNTLSTEAKLSLEKITFEINRAIKSDKLSEYPIADSLHSYGSIHSDYSNLIKSIVDYQNLVNEDNTAFKLTNLKAQINNHISLKALSNQQLGTAKLQMDKAADKLASDQILLDKDVISKLQFYEEEKQYVNAKNEVENIKKGIIQSSITITDLERQLNDLEFEFNQKKKNLLQSIKSSLSTINNALKDWNLNYQITSPIDGQLTYIDQLAENEFVETGQSLFAIVPNNQEYIGYVKIPMQGYGKVLKDQKVRMKMDNFPAHEYGQLNGTVSEISLMPNEESYLIKVSLTNGLMSSYKKELTFTPEMSGTAEIITEDLRLIDRIFNKFRKVFDN